MSIRLIFPLTTLLFFSYAFNYGHGDGLEQWRAVGAFPMPMVRGIADIALGVMLGYIIFNYMPSSSGIREPSTWQPCWPPPDTSQ